MEYIEMGFPENKNKIVCISGNDCCGKFTQTKLLTEILQPSTRIEFPDYTHYSGQIINAILNDRILELKTYPADRIKTEYIKSTKYQQEKQAEIFQLLQSINRRANQDKIKNLLKTGHVICDRYDIDAFAYGMVDGCG